METTGKIMALVNIGAAAVAVLVFSVSSARGSSRQISRPSLNNAQNPVDYGADSGGAADSAGSFQKALDAGDIDVPAGLFRIDTAVMVPSNRNIRCESGSALEYTTSKNIAMFNWSGSTGGSVFNCSFRGPNYNITGKPASSNAFQEFLFIQSIGGKGGGITIANNDFNGIGGWIGAIQLYANDLNQPGPKGVLVTNNTFEHCGLYAVQVTSGVNNTFSYNTLTDCNGFIEADDLGQQNTGNVVDHNTLTYVYGVGQWNPGPAYLALTCGASPAGFNYNGNTCSNNVVNGANAAPSHIIQKISGNSGAQYINNTCSNGCNLL